MNDSRIPEYVGSTFDDMLTWFAEMSVRELLFHPEDRPQDIINIANGEPFFSEYECSKLTTILSSMYEQFGDDVCNAAYPIFMNRMGLPLDA